MGIARERVGFVWKFLLAGFVFCVIVVVMEVVSAFEIFCLGERWCGGERFYSLLELKVWHACGIPGRDLQSKKIKEIILELMQIRSDLNQS